ncbi:MAG: hypothetical protein ABJA66_11400, partial [Actinomycetota bacterium]
EEPKNETEILSADEQKIREICFALKRIDAPKDFDFKLKARIASCQPSDFQPRLGFAFRYAWPALAMIFVLGLLVYNSGFWSSKNNQILAESSVKQNPSVPQNTQVANYTAPISKEQTAENLTVSVLNQEMPKKFEKQPLQVAEHNPQNSNKLIVRQNKNDSITNSKDLGVKPPTVIQPNINSNIAPQSSANFLKINSISVKDVLLILGIDGILRNGKWTVNSLTENGTAARSGIKEDDVIEAIDKQLFSDETIFPKPFNGKTITVTRKGGKMEIKLRNKQ